MNPLGEVMTQRQKDREKLPLPYDKPDPDTRKLFQDLIRMKLERQDEYGL